MNVKQLSSAALRESIRKGEHTAACWRELTERTERWQAAQIVIDQLKAERKAHGKR